MPIVNFISFVIRSLFDIKIEL